MDTKDKMSIIRRRYVVKSNHLVSRVHQLPMNSQKMFCIFIALMNSQRYSQPFYWVTLREISMLLGIETWRDYRSEIVKLINEMENGNLMWLDENTACHFVSSVRFGNNGVVYFEFPEPLIEHVGSVAGTYTKYRLGTILPLKGTYSLRLYEIFKKDTHRRRVQYGLDELRKLLHVSEDKYQQIDHFRKKVLNRSISELNTKTDLQIEYTPLKKPGSKEIVGFEFDISVRTGELKDLEEKIQHTIKSNNKIKTKEFSIPDPHLNSAAFNTVYENFVQHLDNFPDGYTIDSYAKDNGYKIVPNRKGGRDIIYQTRIEY